jgi:hypothetical protein
MQQQVQPCNKSRSYANSNSYVTAGSMQQQDPCNSKSYERSRHTTKAAMQTAAAVQQQELCKKAAAATSNQY